ncbi:MAG: leucyl/phenylalanyl-tRNA--protein transferase [Nitrospirae bacterium]|nr:leucyl/phenylalanyl-tRNA--protein transferase [Nitrospirota bacterium]
MPIFLLSDDISFPPPHLAEKDGLLAVGGDLSQQRILAAYAGGIFPWYTEDSPILWWSPDPRLVLFPDELVVSRSLRQCIRKGQFTVSFNRAFDQVIRSCAEIRRKEQTGTWITGEMEAAYSALHRSGHAVSVEAWENDELAGGLYGIVMGKAFFGESMFARKSNASKAAFVAFVEHLRLEGFKIIDCQMRTGHLLSLGAREIPRTDYLKILKKALK